MDSDDTDTVDFKIYVKKTNEKTINLPVELTYLDKNNNEYTETINVPLSVYSSSEIKKYNLRESGDYTWLAIVVILVGLGYVGYKYFWKRK